MFYASFIVGFENLVRQIFTRDYPEAKILQLWSGAILYQTPSSTPVPAPFLNNQFLVHESSQEPNLEVFISSLNVFPSRQHPDQPFRIIISDQNKLVSINDHTLTRLEKMISQKTNSSPNRQNPDIEYWILKRSEGVILFMERLDKHKSFDKSLAPGQLRDDLCYFLNYLSEPSANDIFLDCFCGSGAIIKNRTKHHDFNMIFGIDTDKDHITDLRKTYKNRNNIIFKNIDFFDNNFNDDFISKIVTDPPWGFYEEVKNIQQFYQKIFDETHRILKPNGIFVLLTARKDEVSNIKTPMSLRAQYDILLSGKKAGVYVFLNP